MILRASRPSDFALRLRIPAWACDRMSDHSVNGVPASAPITAGFATLRRRWKDGDRIDLELPMPMRLEAIDADHPNTVALMRGPLVLFAVTENAPQHNPPASACREPWLRPACMAGRDCLRAP